MASIYIYDSNQWGLFGLAYDRSFQVGSVAEMVKNVLSVTENEKYRSHLVLAGGGGANYQSVGAGANPDPGGDRSLQLNEHGGLLGSAAYWIPRLAGQIYKLHLLGITNEAAESMPLVMRLGTILGVGVEIYYRNGLYLNRGERPVVVRRPTDSATLDREALKKRLSEYTAK
ncbi:MAG: hypothetical protein JSS81_20885 [Acidobacteria bacterium]|nr:hypothetical protein [Acidobacteriota bacterium]